MVKAVAADSANDFPTAVSLYQQQLRAHPNDLAALKGLAADLYVMRRWDEALPVEQKVVQLDPKDAETRIELGFNYLNHQNAAAQAVAVMAQAVQIDRSAMYLTYLGQAQSAAGDFAAAEQTLRRAIAADKTYVHAYTVLVEMLQKEGKTADAAAVVESAKQAGVTVTTDQGPQ